MANVNLKPNVIEPTAPFTSMVAVTPSDSVPLAYPSRALLITVGGAVAVIIGGATVTIPAATAVTGAILPFSVTQVMATNTTATGIFALN